MTDQFRIQISFFYKFTRRRLRILKRLSAAIKWHFKQKADFKLANSSWGYSNFPIDLPLIPLTETYELKPEIEPDSYHYNPSIIFESRDLFICWRVSNFKGSPSVNWAKEDVLEAVKFDPELFRNAVAIGQISNFDIYNHSNIENQRLVTELMGFEKHNPNNQTAYDALQVRTLIDPKFINQSTSLILGNFETWTKSPSGKYSVQQTMGILDLQKQGKCNLIPYQKTAGEKNWCFIASTGDSFKFLRSSSPETVLSVQKRLPYAVINEETRFNSKPFANGGSNFIKVNDECYLRIARYRFSAKGKYNCHISIIVKHDLNFREVARTSPFIFRVFGYEICNGFQLYDEKFVFSWGENDEKMLLGSIEKHKLLDWLEKMWDV